MKTGILNHLSNYQNCVKSTNSKIPEYAREYKREYQFITGINKEFNLLKNRDYDEYGVYRVMNLLKRFLRDQEKGKLKETRRCRSVYLGVVVLLL